MKPPEEEVLAIRETLDRIPDLRETLHRYLDVVDRSGIPPKRHMFPSPAPALQEHLVNFFGRAFCSICQRGVVVQIGRLKANREEQGLPCLEDLLYPALERLPQNRSANRQAQRDHALVLIDRLLAGSPHPAFHSYLEEERRLVEAGKGEFVGKDPSVVAQISKDLEMVGRAVAMALEDGEFLRLSHLGRLIAGSTKSFRQGTALLQRLADILYFHVPGLREGVDREQAGSVVSRRNLVLERTRLLRDGTSDHFLVFGALGYRRGEMPFTWIRDHSRLGEPVRLTWHQWKEVREVTAPSLVTVIENETTFLDHSESVDPDREVVVCCGGQAGWGVVRFLRSLACPQRQFRHWGDLDRSGILILNSLAQRTGLNIEPWRMAPEDVVRLAPLGQPLAPDERKKIEELLRQPPRLAWDCLEAILRQNVWIEQENWEQKQRR